MQTGKERIVEIVTRELRKHEEISFVYLHGSFAEKDTFNDIDIAVYLSKLPESQLEYELKLESKLIQKIGRIVDVRILNSAPLSFRYHVIKKGISLLIRDDNERVEFQEFTLSRYFDFAYFRTLYLKETLGLGV